jgi:hypothetical protein
LKTIAASGGTTMKAASAITEALTPTRPTA